MNSDPKTDTAMKETVSLPTKSRINLKINGAVKQIEVAPWTTLLDALREHLNLTGPLSVQEFVRKNAATFTASAKEA